jgi:serine/threonine protein kinase
MIRNPSLQNIRLSAGVGTPHYIAPEQSGTKYNQKVDIYPLGLIILELSQKFGTQHERILALHQLKKGTRQLPEGFEASYPQEARLALWLSEPNPELRPNAEDVLNSSILEEWKTAVGNG